MELEARLGDLHLLHLVCVGEGEGEIQIPDPAALVHVACGNGPVAIKCGSEVADVDTQIGYVIDFRIEEADGQLAAFRLAHLGCTRLADVDGEIG